MIFPKSKKGRLGFSILITSSISLLLLIIITFTLLEFKVSNNQNYGILDISQNYSIWMTILSSLIGFLFKYGINAYDSLYKNNDEQISLGIVFYPFLLLFLIVFLIIVANGIIINNLESTNIWAAGILKHIAESHIVYLISIGIISLINASLFFGIHGKETQKIKKVTKATVETKIESTTTTTELD